MASGGEEAETNGFWTPEIQAGVLVTVELRGQRSFINGFSGFRGFVGGRGRGVEQRHEEGRGRRERRRGGQGEEGRRRSSGGDERRRYEGGVEEVR